MKSNFLWRELVSGLMAFAIILILSFVGKWLGHQPLGDWDFVILYFVLVIFIRQPRD